VYSRSCYEFFSAPNANRFLSVNQIKLTSFSDFLSISLRILYGALLQSDLRQASLLQAKIAVTNIEKWSIRQLAVVFDVLNNKFVAGVLGIVPAYLPRPHSLLFSCPQLLLTALSPTNLLSAGMPSHNPPEKLASTSTFKRRLKSSYFNSVIT